MKPSDFTLNSDYVALSTAFTTTNTVAFGGGSLPSPTEPWVEPSSIQTADITVPKIDSAEFQYMISLDGQNWWPVWRLEFDYNSSVEGIVMVSRTHTSTMTVTLIAANHGTETASFPSKKFWIKETAVIAPDME